MESQVEQLLADERNREFLQLLLRTKHFEYAYLAHVVQDSAPFSRQIAPGLYADVLLNMIADWTSTSRDHNIPQFENALSSAGFPLSIAARWNEILDSTEGHFTWRQLIKKYRNKPGTHAIFDINAQGVIAEAAGIDPQELPSKLSPVLDDLYEEVMRIRQAVRDAASEYDQSFARILAQTEFYEDFPVQWADVPWSPYSER